MPFDSLVMAVIAQEVGELVPARVDRVASVHPVPTPRPGAGGPATDLVVVVYRPGLRTQIYISMDPRTSRVHLSQRPYQNAPPPPFVQLLRKHLEGALLVSCRQVDRDRVLRLGFRSRTGEERQLVVEIMGPGSNLLLLDENGVILGAWREELPHPSTPRRPVLIGTPYEPPPPPSGPGVGPFAWKEAQARIPADPARAVQEIWRELETSPQPTLIRRADGSPCNYWCLPVHTQEATAPRGDMGSEGGPEPFAGPMSDLIDEFYSQAVAERYLRARREQLAHAVRREKGRLAKLKAALEDEAERAGQAERYRIWGDLLLAQASHLPAGLSTTRVTDYYREDQPEIDIPLDPSLNARDNAERYFRAYRKGKRGLPVLTRRLTEVKRWLSYLEQLEPAIPTADSQTLNTLEEELRRAGIPAGKSRSSRSVDKIEADTVPGRRPQPGLLRFPLAGGAEILVGKSATANDILTFGLARPDDIWLHARGFPGSHVILRPAPGTTPSEEIIEAAAGLAAYYSQGRNSTKVEVDWTPRKHVRRQPGAGPGQVTYRHEHTVAVAPSPHPTSPAACQLGNLVEES